MQTPPIVLTGAAPPAAPADAPAVRPGATPVRPGATPEGQPESNMGFAEALATLLGEALPGQLTLAPDIAALALAPPGLLIAAGRVEEHGAPALGLGARLDRTTEAETELAAALAALLARLQPAPAAEITAPTEIAPVATVPASTASLDVTGIVAPAAVASAPTAVIDTPIAVADLPLATAADEATNPGTASAPVAPQASAPTIEAIDTTTTLDVEAAAVIVPDAPDAADAGSPDDGEQPAPASFEPTRDSEAEALPERTPTALDEPIAITWNAAPQDGGASSTPSAATSVLTAPAIDTRVADAGAPMARAEIGLIELDATSRAALADGLADSVHGATLRGDRELRLALNPPDLGRVAVQISEGEGGLTVQIHTATAEAHDLVQQQLPVLRAGLELRELRVERLHVEQQQATDNAFGSTDGGRREPRGRQPDDEQAPAWSPIAALRRAARPGQVLRGTTPAVGTLDVRA